APFALATPNRFSVSAEPHVGVWGVGWLPTRWQQRYVRMRSGKPYDYVRLLSVPGLKRLMKRETHFDGRFIIPQIADEEIALFQSRRAKVARAYNRAAELRMLRWPLFAIAPFFRFVGVRRSDGSRRAAHMPAEVSVPLRRDDDARSPQRSPLPSPRRDPAHPPAPRGD
ncbi:MAG TPA: hypothetical protein VF488_03450, partial [Gemmatimonadaceae bacterium]